jgi:hypothetical protein
MIIFSSVVCVVMPIPDPAGGLAQKSPITALAVQRSDMGGPRDVAHTEREASATGHADNDIAGSEGAATGQALAVIVDEKLILNHVSVSAGGSAGGLRSVG